MNILEFHRFNEYFATFIAILLNLLVIGLTVTEKNTTIRSYYKIILATSINELVFCVCSLLTVMYNQINNGAVVFVVGSFLKDSSLNVHYALFYLYLFKLGIGINIVPAEYYYRFRTVCRKEALSTFQVFLMVMAGWFYSAFNAATFVWAFSQDREILKQKYGYLFTDPMWKDSNGDLPTFVGTEYTTLIIPFMITAIGANGSYILAINWGLKIYRELNSVKHLMTKRTVRLQTNMTIMLAVQAIFPFMSSALPIGLFMIAVVLQLNTQNFGMIMGSIAVWMPVVSALCPICLLGVYRRRILAIICYKPGSDVRIKSMQTMATITEFNRSNRTIKF